MLNAQRMEASEANEIKHLFSRLAPKEQGLCLGLLLRSRYPQLFQRTPELKQQKVRVRGEGDKR